MDEFCVAVVADEGPALLGVFVVVVVVVVVGVVLVGTAFLDQRPGVLQIAVDGLDGFAYAVLLRVDLSAHGGLDRVDGVKKVTLRICSPRALALMMIR